MGGMTGWRIAALALGVTAALVACSDDGGADPGGEGNPDGGQAGEQPSEEEPAPPELIVSGTVTYAEPVIVEVENGTISAAEVVSEAGALDGTADGSRWTSAATPLPGASYDITVEATGGDGASHTLTGAFTVDEVPDGERLTLSVIRGGGDLVGVGTPIIVKFDQEVEDRAAVEEAMLVASTPQVTGAWYWVNSQEAHFRPQEFWPANTRIRVDLALNGVQAAPDLWGGRSYDYDIQVGHERVARVDASAYTFSLIQNGQTVNTWPTSLGAEEFETRNGIYVVQSKDPEYQMTSCSVGIACDESDPEYYDVLTKSAVRLTNSGTFIHSAPWSEAAQGEANVSHGCLNLSEVDAQTYFAQAQYGDVVEVVGSSREPDDLVQVGDPGMVDWNRSWAEILTLSERGEFTTDQL
jgi:lipoprotein-anchoring transpeptidase ErfK/SrfK